MKKSEWWQNSPNIRVPPPGPLARRIREMDGKYLLTSTKLMVRDDTTRTDVLLAVEEGKGGVLRDVDGNVYIDLISGVATAPIGHCHPKVVKAICKQSGKLINYVGQDFFNESQVKLARN
jgi:4-aminobutyrate aminotransferase